MSDESDYKDYLDYIEYQKHIASPQPAAKPMQVNSAPGAFGRSVSVSNLPPDSADKMQQAVSNSLPLAGGMVGSLAVGPLGAPIGAGVGSMAKNLVSGDQAPPLEAIKNVGSDMVTQGVVPELGGQALGLAGRGLGKAASIISNAARRSGILDQVKAPAGLARNVKDQITSALGKYSENSVASEADKLKEFLTDKTVKVTPRELEGASDPVLNRYAKMLSKSNLNKAVDGQKIENIWSEPVEIKATTANNAKKRAADAANYSRSKPFSEGSSASAEKAEELANMLRQKISNLGPEVESTNNSLQDMIQTRNKMRDMSDTDPIGAIQGRLGGTKSSLTADIDKGAGSNLRQLGGDIELAQTRLGQKGIPESMSALAHRVAGVVPRAGGALAQKIEPHASSVLGKSSDFIKSELAKQGIKLTPSLYKALSQGD